jgi:signal transduction histidine kinase
MQLRKLSESLQTVREEERTRISRELHDELGQQLTGLKLEFSWLSNRILEGREVTRDEIQAMRAQLDDSIAAVRRISTELRPLILDDLGFADAVAWQIEEFKRRTGIATVLEMESAPLQVGDDVSSGLFRIVQESLTNIARHAQATQVRVSVQADSGNLVLSIQDNGIGISDARQRGDGIGLISMRERATAMGARFNVQSAAGQGCVIVVSLAVKNESLGESIV